VGKKERDGRSNKTKAELLGMPHGTACARLRKMILFKFVKQLNLDICFQCNLKIEDEKQLSIEHKIPWQQNPTLFWDLDNIAFSHLGCNIKAADSSKRLQNLRKHYDENGKLSFEKADKIRNKYSPNIYGIRKLAKEFNVDKKAIQMVLKNKIYAIDVNGNIPLSDSGSQSSNL
jgi:hypothetical protein